MNFLYPLMAVLIWSFNAIVSKVSANVIDPAAISFYRWLIALVALTPFVLPAVWRNRTQVRQQWWRLLTLGLLGMVLYQSLAYYAAHSVSALSMGILVSLIPLLTVLISIVLLKVAPTLGILIGSVLSFGGLVWLISQGSPERLLTQGMGTGELMLFAVCRFHLLRAVWRADPSLGDPAAKLAKPVRADCVWRHTAAAGLFTGKRRGAERA